MSAPARTSGRRPSRSMASSAGLAFPRTVPPAALTPVAKGRPGENTSIAIVATDADLSKAQAKELAVIAQDGLARAIYPAHTTLDGDTVFAAATGRRPLTDADQRDHRTWGDCRQYAGAGRRAGRIRGEIASRLPAELARLPRQMMPRHFVCCPRRAADRGESWNPSTAASAYGVPSLAHTQPCPTPTTGLYRGHWGLFSPRIVADFVDFASNWPLKLGLRVWADTSVHDI